MAEQISRPVEVAVVTVELVAPDDGSGMGTTQRVAQFRFGPFGADRGAIENQPDDLEAFGMGAAGQFVVFRLHLRGDTGQRGLDEVVDGAGRHV
ncbi:Uncharacterised protein [Mycobacterium tuberculosis]|uniref:Uncharacterized protein n=1 Tax=Mycobacterium tuberculosis TaxID=1773 RepID=A0A916LFV4_MYCTX|nr:Uncharacterised protein [Mycobacterium tuberculosis]COX38700.1 Uncharacterised protein [Mycobacterium tuberculosis]COZ19669.1 Uncharacterised protein [Mycobacterium tuberculosis]CPA57413.1 Uncharacterised protein [Mycobacterium tuberculosis]